MGAAVYLAWLAARPLLRPRTAASTSKRPDNDLTRRGRAFPTGIHEGGYERIEAVRARYGGEPCFRYVHGDVAWAVLGKSSDILRALGPHAFASIKRHYDPMPVLRNFRTRQLWLLGENDTDAPSAETARGQRTLASQNHPISVVVFPNAEHVLYEYEAQPDGTRVSTRHPADYFKIMRDFILEKPAPPPPRRPISLTYR